VVSKTIRKKLPQVAPDIVANYCVESGEIPAGLRPLPKSKISRQWAIVFLPLTENKPTMPYLGQVVKIPCVPVNGKDVEGSNISHAVFQIRRPRAVAFSGRAPLVRRADVVCTRRKISAHKKQLLSQAQSQPPGEVPPM